VHEDRALVAGLVAREHDQVLGDAPGDRVILAREIETSPGPASAHVVRGSAALEPEAFPDPRGDAFESGALPRPLEPAEASRVLREHVGLCLRVARLILVHGKVARVVGAVAEVATEAQEPRLHAQWLRFEREVTGFALQTRLPSVASVKFARWRALRHPPWLLGGQRARIRLSYERAWGWQLALRRPA
jgi:hypothetical protein